MGFSPAGIPRGLKSARNKTRLQLFHPAKAGCFHKGAERMLESSKRRAKMTNLPPFR